MNSWRDFWTATPARVWIYHFVLLPLVAVALVLTAAVGRVLMAVAMAVWALCAGVTKDAEDAVRFWRDSYRDGMKQAEEKGGAQ